MVVGTPAEWQQVSAVMCPAGILEDSSRVFVLDSRVSIFDLMPVRGVPGHLFFDFSEVLADTHRRALWTTP